MDNFTEGRIKRAKDVISRLHTIDGVLANAYKGITPDGEVKYDAKAFLLEANAGSTISNAIALIEELIESWEKEAEDKKTESHALDILKRLQTENPVYYKSVNSIEVTPSSEKLTFWIPDSDEFKDPEPELLDNKKVIEEDTPMIDPYIEEFSDFLDDWGEYENHELELDEYGNICIRYDNPDGHNQIFYLNEFNEGLHLIAKNYVKTNSNIKYGFNALNRIINNFDSYENVRLEKGLNGVYLKYDNKDNGCSFMFQFSVFIKELQGKEEND